MRSIFVHPALVVLGLIAFSNACVSARKTPSTSSNRLLFIGQDLDSIRGYFSSQCCQKPDGLTAYLSLYRLLEGKDFGGLGYAPDGTPLSPEASWGAGRVGARQTATEFGIKNLAIGLFIAENEVPGGLAKIAAGELDPEIKHLGAFIRSVDGQVFLRIGYEFDGLWNDGSDNVDAYKAAFQRIVTVLRAEKTNNAIFVWQASASIIDDLLEKKHEDISDWYPGDEYVDWMALSWFTHPEQTSTVETEYIPKTSGELANEVAALARIHQKPVMIAEASPQGYDIHQRTRAHIGPILDGPAAEGRQSVSDDELWNQWYAPLFAWIHTHRDVVKALAYINANWDTQEMWGAPYNNGYWGDSRLESNPTIAQRFEASVQRWKASK